MKFRNPLLIVALLVLSAFGAAAQATATSQNNVITKKDFEKVYKRAEELLKTTSYRVTNTVEYVFLEQLSDPAVFQKTVKEYVPPDRSYVLDEFTLIKGKPITHEWITIGKQKFLRKYGGKYGDPWKKVSQSKKPIRNRITVVSAQYFSDGTVLIDGKKVSVFVVVRKIKIREGSPPTNVPYQDKATFWYENNGRLLKLVSETQGDYTKDSDPENLKYRETAIFEYEPNIKIEAPIKYMKLA